MECEVTDEISVEAQEQISKYLSSGKARSLEKLNPQVRDFLATQRLQQLFSKQSGELNIRARASLIPLDLKKRDHCPLTFRTFKIGQGSTVDLDLSTYGSCQCISNFHASIFFDQYARIFELMNYSEHGTIGNDIDAICRLFLILKLKLIFPYSGQCNLLWRCIFTSAILQD